MVQELILLVAGLLAGSVISYFIIRAFYNKTSISQDVFNELLEVNKQLQIDISSRLTRDQVEKQYVIKEWFNNCNEQLNQVREELKIKEQQIIELTSESEQKTSKGELETGFVGKDIFNLVSHQFKTLQLKNDEDNKTITRLIADNTKLVGDKVNADIRLKEFNEELVRLQELSRDNFKNLANEIFIEKSKDFSHTNKESMDKVLDPFKTQLD
ncbi:MAG TPA: hypothetical protein VGO09_09745, partial [Flavisolibacter sp.]|nr:hypothetical protein [Flavisolibacter sp.]